MDILHDYLVRARAAGAVFARSVVRPPWGLTLPGSIQLSLHTVVRGHAWVWLDNPAEAERLLPGDLAVVVGGRDHHLADEPSPDRCVTHEQFWAAGADEDPDAPHAAVFLCGAYRLAGDVGQSLIRALPPMLVIRPSAHDHLHGVVSLISSELTQSAPGQQTVLDRLLDVLLVLVMRASYQDSSDAPSWYRAAQDPRLGRALQAMHEEPARSWTVPELANLSAMSRPSFARNFERALGQTPMQYLTDWRLTLAREYLIAGELTLEQIARRTGYSSPNAFAATFRRHVGIPPGRWRQEVSG
ncbi:cupin domain-containing protein [Streptomyces sp. NPDC003233]|uniref:AraC family transcriptional regulator n=1 Tax=Streptomyces mirabilis TaxID=68239 RepID=UPI003654DE6D